MVKVVTQVKVKGSDGVRTVSIREAQQGPHKGQLYLNCSCAGGRFSWSPAGYHPCKHAAEVLKEYAIRLQDGHFAQMPEAIVAGEFVGEGQLAWLA